ncbi:MAG: taurine catabolism dioxygenase TauD [Gammaproteobacteria bacterium]|nr:MAG: taurine catabolism dioxygenase TauD [Gammaproteobacteria bacterium]
MKNNNNNNKAFNLKDDYFYQQWREQKLTDYPTNITDLLVNVNMPHKMDKDEKQQILTRVKKANMAIYVSDIKDSDINIPLQTSAQFGLKNINSNWLAQNKGVSSLQVEKNRTNQHYIPYTNKAINWHTDGYYNALDKQIYALNLHCVSPAFKGGKNKLLDHEIAYILLRDENPDYIKALSDKNAMTIPAREKPNGKIARKTITGPVFSVNDDGFLHMRHTIRKKFIHYADDNLTCEAVQFLNHILQDESNKYIFYGKLEAGMGLISHNILHTRDGFEDSENQKRLIYRTRFFDRIDIF